MFILGGKQRYCDRVSRRGFLKIGAFGAGLTLADMLRVKASAAPGQASPRLKSAIMVYLGGGPSHMDMYDLKPDSPVEFRGEFNPIQTNVPGVQISEHFPEQARIWDKLEKATRNPQPAGHGRAVAVAEVGYPRTAGEAEALGGQALLLVTALAQKIDDALIERVTLHFEDGQESGLVRLTAQLNDVAEDDPHPAAQSVGPYRHDSLFFIPLATTGTKAFVTATYAGRTEVVARFPRAPAAYPSTLPVLKPGVPARIVRA